MSQEAPGQCSSCGKALSDVEVQFGVDVCEACATGGEAQADRQREGQQSEPASDTPLPTDAVISSGSVEQDQPWYRRPWVAVGTLILFFPLGLLLTWRFQRWRTWVKVAATLGSLVIAWVIIVQIWNALYEVESSVGDGTVEYGLALGDVIGTVNQAGLGVADGFIAVSTCSTDDECLDAGDLLVREYKAYIPVLEDQIRELDTMDPPEDYREFHVAYAEQLRLRVEAGEMIIDGWESYDDDLLGRGFYKFTESQAKAADIMDALRPLLEEQ